MAAGDARHRAGARLRAERKLRLWDVPQMARQLASAAGSSRRSLPAHDVLVGYVRRWEAGRAGISDRFRMLYAAAFGISEHDLFPAPGETGPGGAALARGLPVGGWAQRDNEGLAGMLATGGISAGNAAQVAHEWLVTEPPQVYEVRAGRHVGSALAAQIEERVARLRTLDDYIGGEDLREVVQGELAVTAGLLGEASYTERDGRRLLGVFADMCQIGGWIASDAGQHAAAERWYLTGVRAAFAAADKPTAANLLSSLSYQVANTGDARQAVLLARSARAGAALEATPLMRALLAERAAWAHARLPEGQGSAECERALGEADQAFSEHSAGAEEPGSVYWLDRGEIDVMAGRCYTELARPLKAQPLLVAVLARYDDSHAREKALYETWLAETYLHAREVTEAANAAARALELSSRVHSARSRDRIRHVRSQLLPHAPGNAAVREFEDRYAAAELGQAS